MNNTTLEAREQRDTEETNRFLELLKAKYSHQPVFLQAVEEMAKSLKPLFEDKAKGNFYKRAFLVITEPERIISFRVSWEDDQGNLQTNRGWRVEFNSALGPYKGGLRFHPSVDEGILKSLGFEQIFKNALTGLPIGGGKGGSDFDPKNKSDDEVRRFCQSFMSELSRYLHPYTDVPAGDIGVGGRELGFLYGEYKKHTNRHGDGVLTGKPLLLGGSHMRPEATGFGLVYMAMIAVEKNDMSLKSSKCAVSGSGNVAQYTVKKLIDVGAKVVSISDSNGTMVFPCGITLAEWNMMIELKQNRRGRLSELQNDVNGEYVPDQSPWTIRNLSFDFAFPCATQNEISEESMSSMIDKGLKGVFEGSNLPTTIDAQTLIQKHKIMYIPGKASNAGGVAVSGFEMSQNAQRLNWTSKEVDEKLQETMGSIYKQMEIMSQQANISLEEAANRVGFIKVADAMKELGWIW